MYELLNYDPLTGVFTYKTVRKGCRVGNVAGWVHRKGYRYIMIDYVNYAAHRLAWAYYYGKDPGNRLVDHKHHNRDDNRISELRLATEGQSARNKPAKGITQRQSGNWQVYLQIEGANKCLGTYVCPVEAKAVFEAARKERDGRFYCQPA